MATTKPYNYCLDFIKGIACLCVVFMHCEFPGSLGIIIQAISRFCVPFFFMVSGYFCYYPRNGESGVIKERMIKKIKHIGSIVIWSSLFYFLIAFGTWKLYGYPSFLVTMPLLFRFLGFNSPFIIAGHLWFLFALLYDYVIFGFFWRIGKVKMLYPVALVMVFAYIALAQGAHLAGFILPNWLYRNWLIEGLVFFMMGHWIHSNQEKLSLSNGIILGILLLSTLLCLLERYLMGRDFGVNVMTFPQVFALFLYAINNTNRHAGVLQVIGERYSMWVYILHPFVWHSMDGLYKRLSLTANETVAYLRPVVAVLLTLALSAFCYWVIEENKKAKKTLLA